MYEKVVPITLKRSTSFLFNNVDVLNENASKKTGSVHIAYDCWYLSVHKGHVNIVTNGNNTLNHKQVTVKESSNSHSCLVTQARWCRLSQHDTLVVAHHRGFQIYDGLGNLLLFYYDMLESGMATETQTAYCRGIACSSDQVYVGCCTGVIFIVKCKGNNFTIVAKLTDHVESISALASSTFQGNQISLASCDDKGSLLTWQRDNDKMKCIERVSGSGYPGTGIVILPNNLVVCAYTTGHIRIFDGLSGNMTTEISAHGRAVAGLSNANYNAGNVSMVISASEDSMIRIWKISYENGIVKVHQDWSTCLKDVFICGVKFCDDMGSAFAVTGYDRNEITIFTKV